MKSPAEESPAGMAGRMLAIAAVPAALCGAGESLFWVSANRAFASPILAIATWCVLSAAIYAIAFGLPAATVALMLGGRIRSDAIALAALLTMWLTYWWQASLFAGTPLVSTTGLLGVLVTLGAAGVAAVVVGRCQPGTVRRTVASVAAVIALVYLAQVRPSGAAVDLPQPAVPKPGWTFLVVVDTLGAKHTSLGGSPRTTTPNLDAFARDSVVFDHAIAPSSWTSPSMASILTGLSAATHQYNGWRRLSEKAQLLPEQFERAGFVTAAFVANSAAGHSAGFGQGFRHYDDRWARVPPSRALGDTVLIRLAARLNRTVRNLRARRPRGADLNRGFFEWFDEVDAPGGFVLLHYMDVHDPYDPPAEFRVFGTSAEDLYDGDVFYWDSLFGELLDFLDERGALAEATILVTADHGEEFGEHGGTLHGHSLYQEIVHVPLVVRSPGVPPGRIEGPVSLIDLAPTILDLAGLDPLTVREGSSLRPQMQAAATVRSGVQTEHMTMSRRSAHVAFYAPPWKLVYWPAFGQGRLFNLTEDPDEQINLIEGEQTVALELLRSFRSVQLPYGLTPPSGTLDLAVDPGLTKALRALGYVH